MLPDFRRLPHASPLPVLLPMQAMARAQGQDMARLAANMAVELVMVERPPHRLSSRRN